MSGCLPRVRDARRHCSWGTGGKVTRDAGPVQGGKTIIAFVEDNTGYKWELIQKPADFLQKKRDPVLHVRVPSTLPDY